MVCVTTVYVLLVSLSSVSGECHCKTDDLCVTFPASPCSVGGGPDNCQQGWFGLYCQKENVALKRPSNQSSTYMHGGFAAVSSLAVDGITSHDFYSKPRTCTANVYGDQNISWTVYLNKTVTDKIQHIKLYLRSYKLERNNGIKILVDGVLCYNWSTSGRPNSTEDVTCRQPLPGNTVTITAPASNIYFVMCEVQIFICRDGWFGDDCDKQCNCQNEAEVCDKISGQCPNGCAAGFSDTDCQTYAECHCRRPSDCEAFPSTPCSAEGTLDSCHAGWFGPYCQKQNVALKGLSNQSSIYNDGKQFFPASYAVDGRTSRRFSSQPRTCSRTGRGDPNPTWTAHLDKFYDIYHLRLYLRSFEPYRNKGMVILVDNMVCFNWSSSDQPEFIQDVVCHQPMAGNAVTITIPKSGYYLILCEVQVFICNDGWFGKDCDKQCHCMNKTEVCDKTSGNCMSGCAAGFIGTSCHEVCDDGMYGAGCNSSCGYCTNSSICDKATGHCLNGCQGNFTAPFCDGCSDGWFGEECDKQCHCQNKTEVCDKASGNCVSGCAAGFREANCHKACDDGMYGLGCNSRCGHCTNVTICDKSTGQGLHGCLGNFTAPFCEECLDGNFGPNCNETCGLCEEGDPCNKTTGRCPRGCVSGNNQEDVLCRTSTLSPESTAQVGIVAAAAGGAAAVIVVIVVIAVVVVITKRRQREHGDSSINKDNTSSQVEGAMDLQMNAINAGDHLPLLDEDEDAVFYVENDLYVSSEDMSTYYNWVPPDMTLDKLQHCVMDMKTRSTLETQLKAIPCGLRRAHDIGKKPENKVKNRFAALYPYDHSRVVLDVDGYINANYITGFHDTPRYIATQGPTSLTFGDFWRMICQERVTTVVMLTQLVEHKKKKCDKYWSNEIETKQYGGFTVTNKEMTVRADYTVSKLVIHNSNSEDRTVRHFHFTTWPDHGVPSVPALVSFWKKVKENDKRRGPLVVHCSAGVGRTGTFIALDYLVDEYESEYKVNVFRCVTRMREARMNMVQTLSQYQFVHDAVLEAVYSRDTKYTSTDLTTLFATGNINADQLDNKLKQQFKLLQSLRPPLPDSDISQPLLYENSNQDVIYENKAQVHLGTSALTETGQDGISSINLPSVVRASMFVVIRTPLPCMAVDFWRMVTDNDCFTVVCLDVSKEPRDLYPDLKKEIRCGSIIIKHIDDRDTNIYRETRLVVTNTNQGSGLPLTVFSLKSLDTMSRDTGSLLTLVNRVDEEICSNRHKVLVHCPDGSHDCGIFCAAMNVIGQLRLDSEVDIFLTVRELQCLQPRFIQSYEQYRLCYDLVREFIRSSDGGVMP